MARRTSPKPATGKLNIFGAKIRRLREAAGLRQNELTHRLQRAGWDVDPGTTNRIETGARTLTDIELTLILRVLGKRLSDCEVTGLLKQVVYIDIVGLDIESARQRILDQLEGKSARSKTGTSAPAAKKAKAQSADPKAIQQTATAGRDVFQAAGDLNFNKQEVVRPVILREPHHITEAQAAEILDRLKELGERDEKAGRGSTYGGWMNRFKRKFGVASYARLDATDFENAIDWLKQQKAMNRSRLRRTSNKAWREDHYTIIYGCVRKLGWDKPQLYLFAFEKLELKKPIQSLKELGEQNLERLAAMVRRLAEKAGRMPLLD